MKKLKITPALLHKLYTQSDKSGLQVSGDLGIGRTTLGRYLKKFGIPSKSISEVMTGKKLSPNHRLKVIKTLRSGLLGKENPAWKGGIIKKGGYVFVRKPNHPLSLSNGYIAEHRLVMEKKLGRYLKKSENIHHKNGNKTDNRVENLMIVSRSKHSKIHFSDPKMKKKISSRMTKLYQDPSERQKQSERMRRARKVRFWSTKKDSN